MMPKNNKNDQKQTEGELQNQKEEEEDEVEPYKIEETLSLEEYERLENE